MIELQEYISLAEHNTFRVGGPARFLTVARTVDEVREAKVFAQTANISFFVLGGGSNILFADQGFKGLVIKMAIGGIAMNSGLVVAGAGVVWDELVASTVAHGLSGLENLSGIPGTVGGAVAGNVGAYGREVCDVLEWVEVVDDKGVNIERLTVKECRFGYRSSFFKMPIGRKFTITRAAFRLFRRAKLNIEYPDLQAYFSMRDIAPVHVTSRLVRTALLEIRASKLPDLRLVGTAGSFFKNPVIDSNAFKELKKIFPEMPGFPDPNLASQVKVPAGWILDKVCGLKGKRWGAVGIHDQQALVLINFGGAPAAAIAAAGAEMAAAVKVATGITLEREVEYLF